MGSLKEAVARHRAKAEQTPPMAVVPPKPEKPPKVKAVDKPKGPEFTPPTKKKKPPHRHFKFPVGATFTASVVSEQPYLYTGTLTVGETTYTATVGGIHHLFGKLGRMWAKENLPGIFEEAKDGKQE